MSESPPSAPDNGPLPYSDEELELLRDLLLRVDRSRLNQLEYRLNHPTVLANQVVDYISTESSAGDRRLADAVAPVLGPAIRKAVLASFRERMQALDQALRHAFSIKGMSWRWEAFKTGRQFSEVVLLHSMEYRVEQVFLIHRESGILLHHVHVNKEESGNEEVVAGLLNAIRDFARDSFSPEGGQAELNRFESGDRRVWLEEGPQAYLASVIRGQAPEQELQEQFETALQDIHVLHSGQMAEFNGDTSPFAESEALLEDCLVYKAREEESRRNWLAWGLLATAAALLTVWLVMDSRDRRQWDEAIAVLEAEPGIQILDTERNRSIRGRRDVLSREPSDVLVDAGRSVDALKQSWDFENSFDPDIVLARIRSRLAVPESVKLTLNEEGTLIASGLASTDWANGFRDNLSHYDGFRRYEDTLELEDEAYYRSWSRFVSTLKESPGIVVLHESMDGGYGQISGLRDDFSADPAILLTQSGLPPERVASSWKSFISSEGDLVEQRLNSMLRPPAGVEYQLDGKRLLLQGEASSDWLARVEALANSLNWIDSVQADQLTLTDEKYRAPWNAYVKRLKAAKGLRVMHEEFKNGKGLLFGLFDPASEVQPASLRSDDLAAFPVEEIWSEYESDDPALKLVRILSDNPSPPSATVRLIKAGIALEGTCYQDWLAAMIKAAKKSGFDAVDTEQVTTYESILDTKWNAAFAQIQNLHAVHVVEVAKMPGHVRLHVLEEEPRVKALLIEHDVPLPLVDLITEPCPQLGSWQNYIADIKQRSDLVLDETSISAGQFSLRGWRDPMGVDPLELAVSFGVDPDRIHDQWEWIVSNDPLLLSKRIDEILEMPDSVTAEVRDGELHLTGVAEPSWIGRVKRCQTALPVSAINLNQMRPWNQAEFDRLAAELESIKIGFKAGTDQMSTRESVLTNVATRVQAMAKMFQPFGTPLPVLIIGTSDARTSLQGKKLAMNRAVVLRRWLIEFGIEEDSLETSTENANERSVFLRIDHREGPPS